MGEEAMQMECSETEQNQCEKKGTSEQVILSAKNLTLGYGKTDIVQGVTLTIHRAEIVTIIGPNGSGKSTLLKALARILPLRSGRIELAGKDIWEQPMRQVAQRIAFLPQSADLPADITVLELVRMGRLPHRGFWDGYYLGQRLGEWTPIYGSAATKQKVYKAKVTNYFSKLGVAELSLEAGSLAVGDEILITGPTTGLVRTTLQEIRFDLQPIERGEQGTRVSIPVPSKVRPGDRVYLFEERVVQQEAFETDTQSK